MEERKFCTKYHVLSTKYNVRSTHRGGQARYDIPANDECPTPNVELRSRKTHNYLNALLCTSYLVQNSTKHFYPPLPCNLKPISAKEYPVSCRRRKSGALAFPMLPSAKTCCLPMRKSWLYGTPYGIFRPLGTRRWLQNFGRN